jgi:N-acetylmuramoyl-L-alanine amidase
MKAIVDAGHGGRDSGATFGAMREADVTLAIVKEMQLLTARSKFIDLVFTRATDDYLSLRDRVNLANATGADLFVSVHTNADPDPDRPGDPEARGMEVWHHPDSVKGGHLAKELGRGMKLEFPDEPYRGEKARALYVVRKTVMPAALVEVGFIDNSDTARKFTQPEVLSQIAFSLVVGLIGYHRVT